MQIDSDSELTFLYRVNDIVFCWRNFVGKFIFSICYAAFILNFGFLEEIIEIRYIGIFPFIGKIIDIDIKLLDLSVIWRNYRYRNWQEIYRKIIDIDKNDLSPTPTQTATKEASMLQGWIFGKTPTA